jgi:hypothetical protein
MNPLSSSAMLQPFGGVLAVLLGVVGVFVVPAVFAPRSSEKVSRRALWSVARLAEKKALVIALIFLAVICVRIAVLPLLPVPVPGIHDEFSYLLMADTFAHGRLANPTHPMWISFESFHVNWFPTYSSKYPPGQGAVLALGQLLWHPWAGVVLSIGAMCAAILWMLQAWLPARWALLGGALAAMKLGIASYWMNSYWGGAVAATGGALVLGAMPRIVRHARVRDALLLGLGLAILANTRPYEGLLFCIPMAGWFVWWLAGKTKSPSSLRTRVTCVLLPLAGVLLLTMAFMGYYNKRLTENALLFPHVLNTRTYRTAGLFLWDHAKPPVPYNNQQFEDFYNGWERGQYHTNWHDALSVTSQKIGRMGMEFFWPGAILLLPGLFVALRDRRMRLPAITLAVCLAGIFSVIWSVPHYAAPVTGVVFLLLVQAIRRLRTVRLRQRPIGLALSWAAVCLLAIEVGADVAKHRCDPMAWTCQGDPSREVIKDKLLHTPGKHLILVRYGKNHNIHDEWVYNGAEIDSAKVLWAREVDATQNARLLHYFRDRQVWLAEPDKDNTELIPYPHSGPATGR